MGISGLGEIETLIAAARNGDSKDPGQLLESCRNYLMPRVQFRVGNRRRGKALGPFPRPLATFFKRECRRVGWSSASQRRPPHTARMVAGGKGGEGDNASGGPPRCQGL